MPRGLALLLAGAITLTAWFLAFRPGARLPASTAARGLGPVNGRWRPVLERSEAEWRRELLPLQYEVLRRGATERAFTGAYWNHRAVGTYLCAACGAPLFGSRAKFDSGTGWPSFTAPLSRGAVVERDDPGLFEGRVEVLCARCGGHLGHVFGDGPPPSGLRYCLNSASLRFEPLQ
jgi:peptide-methionine (R)-S-oxide reductase